MKDNRKKNIFIMILSIIGILCLTVGVSIAFFNYTRTGSLNTLSVGRISFVTRQTSTISLTNLFPIDPTESGIMNDSTKVGTLTIEIEGDTDYSNGIEYLVSSVDSSITTSTGKLVPISLDVTVNSLGTPNTNYFTARESTNASIYKKLVGSELVGDQMLIVGFIKPNTTSGTAEGIDGSITIKAYLDKNKIGISDTYDGSESDNMGTTSSWAAGRTILTTSEWNSLQSSGVSFKVKVEANEGIWVRQSLDDIIRVKNLNTTTNLPIMDNVASEFVTASTGINFGAASTSTNGQGVYMRAGTENDAYPIVYYRGAVEDNNVIFNNKCWKAVRTTDTGGVKLIYNGEIGPVYDYGPLNESEYVIPSGATNHFTFNSTDNSWEITITDNAAKEISFQVPAGNGYRLVQIGTSGSSSGGGWSIYKDGISVLANGNGGGNPMNDTYEFGTLTSSNVIKWKYTGSSSLESPITFKLQMKQAGRGDLVGNGCDNMGVDTHINISGMNMFAFNTSYNSPAYVGYMYGTVYEPKNGGKNGIYWSDVDYSNGVYTLKTGGTTNGSPNSNHHYICEDSSNCTKLRYYYEHTFYIELENGDKIEKAIEKMQTNTTNSNAKTQIDSWYASNMNTVTSRLEDTVWCNDRSIGKYNGWSTTGTDTWYYTDHSPENFALLFGAIERSDYASSSSTEKNRPSLVCVNKNDAFTVSNGNGNEKLTYPVALLTEDEMVLAGGVAVSSSSNFYLNNGSNYWSLSPEWFSGTDSPTIFNVSDGSINADYVARASGLRPSVSLKLGASVISGTGTVADPYVIG